MFCSTIIPTVARPSLERSVTSVLAQGLPDDEFEVIVVNDSGSPLPPAAWQTSARVRVLNTNRRERVIARNAGAAVARGEFLHFLDDDDWLLPGALSSLRALVNEVGGVVWYCAAVQLVDRSGSSLIVLDPALNGNVFTQVMAGEWVPLQTSLVRADVFFRVGGFHPATVGVEDVDLARRMALQGDFHGGSGIVGCVQMGAAGSTTDSVRARRLGQAAREDILDHVDAFNRFLGSSGGAFWAGRVVRVFLTSAAWNLRRGRVFHAAGRLVQVARFLIRIFPRSTAPALWKAVFEPYRGRAFERGMRALQTAAQHN